MLHLFWILANKFLRTPHTLQTLVHALGCSAERDGKTLLLKTHILE